jgi:K+-sensing histidine kinase KdpD
LLENLLQWSKYQSQGSSAKRQYTELTALVNDIISYQNNSAVEKEISISNTLAHHIFVYADEEMVKNLLKSILQNIVKLSEPAAIISISGDKDKKNGWLQIYYTGQMALKHVFLHLSQADSYGSETTELGKAISLGWMLCRTLAKVNNGSICVEDISAESFKVILLFPLEI